MILESILSNPLYPSYEEFDWMKSKLGSFF